MLQTAAVKISFKEPRKKFLQMIASLKSYGTTKVHLIHVRTKSRYLNREEVEDRIEALSKEIEAMGFSFEVHIQNGHAPSVIVEIAGKVRADYISIFWRSKGLLKHALLGSIDSDILRMSNLPVFIYKRGLLSATVELKNVLYATDFKSTDAVVMPYLVDSRFKAEILYLLHVRDRAPDPATDQRLRQSVVDGLEELARQCVHAYDRVETVETMGLVHREIVKQANARNVDLIIIGKPEKPATLIRFVGSTAEILPHKSRCSVFVIPSICRLVSKDNSEEKEMLGS